MLRCLAPSAIGSYQITWTIKSKKHFLSSRTFACCRVHGRLALFLIKLEFITGQLPSRRSSQGKSILETLKHAAEADAVFLIRLG